MVRNIRRNGFTLVEVLIVVIIMAVLAATIIPQFTDSSTDAKTATCKFNVNTLRSQLSLYKAQHNGAYPTTMGLLTLTTNADHTTTGTPTLGPYLQSIPSEPVSNSTAVAASTGTPISVSGTTGGWIYNSTSGEVRANTTSNSAHTF